MIGILTWDATAQARAIAKGDFEGGNLVRAGLAHHVVRDWPGCRSAET
jgi:hypothetical protein